MSAYTWFGLATVILIFYGPFQNVLEAVARHHLFSMRDHLFDRAAKGEIEFDSEDYRRARDQFNCLIRFTHKLKWQNLWVMYKFAAPKEEEHQPNPLYDGYRQKVAAVMISLIIMRSPLLSIGLIGVGLFAFINARFASIKRKAGDFMNFIENRSIC